MPAVNLEALMASHAGARLTSAMMRMFDSLRPFMRAYARTHEEQEKLPELDMVWMTGLDGGPDRVVLEAIKANPELWAHAVPDECCIVPRDMLKRAVGSDVVCEALIHHGSALVGSHAARAEYDAEQKRGFGNHGRK